MRDQENEDRLERQTLGACLRDRGALADVVPLLTPQDFRVDRHQRVWSTLVALWDAGRPVDLVSLADALHARGWTEEAPYHFLAALWDEVATGANARYYAQRTRDCSILRQLTQAGQEIARLSLEPEDSAEQTLERAERLVCDVSRLGFTGAAVPLDDVVREVGEHLDRMSSGEGQGLVGLPTGFRDLDEITAGLQNSELTLLAARPSCGKTALGVAIARNAIHQGRPTFFASLEQSRQELVTRLLCAEANVDGQRLRKRQCSPNELQDVCRAIDDVRGSPLFIDDHAGQSMLRIAANARRLKARGGLALVVVDYLQLIDPENRKEPRHEQVGGISRRLKLLAKELACPVLALAQLNRGVEERTNQRPRLSDLRESGSLEADADVVLLLHKLPQAPDLIEVIVAKQRNGPVGEVCLHYNRACMRFEDLAVGRTPFGMGDNGDV